MRWNQAYLCWYDLCDIRIIMSEKANMHSKYCTIEMLSWSIPVTIHVRVTFLNGLFRCHNIDSYQYTKADHWIEKSITFEWRDESVIRDRKSSYYENRTVDTDMMLLEPLHRFFHLYSDEWKMNLSKAKNSGSTIFIITT